MKLYIKSKGNGWFTVANNYKDKEDSCTLSLYFPKKTTEEPEYIPTDDGKAYTIAIDPIEWKLTSYKGKAGMTIFKYKVVEDKEEEDTSMFGGDRSSITEKVGIKSDELPFY